MIEKKERASARKEKKKRKSVSPRAPKKKSVVRKSRKVASASSDEESSDDIAGCQISGSGKTLKVRTLGCARRSLPHRSRPHTLHDL